MQEINYRINELKHLIKELNEKVSKHERLLSKHLDENSETTGNYQSIGAVLKKLALDVEELKKKIL